MERARELFLRYNGNRFYMDHDGVGYEYDGYHVPKETEAAWARESVLGFLGSKTRGKEALRAYSAAAEFVGRAELVGFWERCLFYPFRAEHLDDVTTLFMLSRSYRMAESAAKRRRLLRSAVDAYVRELDGYIRRIQERMAAGTLTRDADYDMNEFSDPVYVEDYLSDLRKKWAGV
jgi:hypothetical protein